MVFALTTNYIFKLLDVDSWKKFSAKAEVFNTIMLDNALVLNPLLFLSEGWNRLKTNRYSLDVINLKAPFNVTQACKDRVFTNVPSTYTSQLHGFPGLNKPAQSQVESRVYKGPPLPYDCHLEEVPHRIWEYPLALPDVLISIAGTIWGSIPAKTMKKFGKEYPVDVPLSAQISPWVRRTLLLIGLLLSLVFALQPSGVDSETSDIFLVAVFQYAFGILFFISIGALVLAGIMSLILWIGDQDNQITAATSGLGTVGIILKGYFDEVKALIADTTKEKIGESLMGKSTGPKPDATS